MQGQPPLVQYANGQLTLPSAPPPAPQIKIVLRFANIYMKAAAKCVQICLSTEMEQKCPRDLLLL